MQITFVVLFIASSSTKPHILELSSLRTSLLCLNSVLSLWQFATTACQPCLCSSYFTVSLQWPLRSLTVFVPPGNPLLTLLSPEIRPKFPRMEKARFRQMIWSLLPMPHAFPHALDSIERSPLRHACLMSHTLPVTDPFLSGMLFSPLKAISYRAFKCTSRKIGWLSFLVWIRLCPSSHNI